MSQWKMKLCLLPTKLWTKVNRRKAVEPDILATDMKRCLNTMDLVFVGLSHMLGPAIFVVTGVIMLQQSGASVTVSYILAAIVAMLNAICYAQFSVNLPKAGTSFIYSYVVLGELWGFLSGWNILLEYIIIVASVGRSLSAYIDSLTGNVISNTTQSVIGHVDSPVFGQVDVLAGCLVATTFIIVAVGVRLTVRFLSLATFLNILVICVIAILGFSFGDARNFDGDHGGFFPFGFSGTLVGAATCFYAFIGFDAIAIAAEETKEPNRALPMAMILTIVIATILYSSAAFALSLLVPYYMVDVEVPFPNAFARVHQPWAMYICAFGPLFGMIASLVGQTYCLPRSVYALSDEGLIFSKLKYIHPWTQTPLLAIFVTATLSTILAMFFALGELVEMVSIGSLFAMTVMIISLLKLHYLPVEHCPFELDSQSERNSEDTNETMPIVAQMSERGVTHRIGHPRRRMILLENIDSTTVTSSLIFMLVVSTSSLSLLLVRGWRAITEAEFWAIGLLVIVSIVLLLSFIVLLMFEPNRFFKKFSVPWVPWTPVLSLIGNFALMMSLSTPTWIRLVVWMAVGLLIYFCYGIRHSAASRENNEVANDVCMVEQERKKRRDEENVSIQENTTFN